MAVIAHDRVRVSDAAVEQARSVLPSLEGAGGSLVTERDGIVGTALPPELGRILQQVVDAVASGRAVTVSAVPDELTTSAAADLLGISRPTLMKRIAEGRIAAHKVGSHTRLTSSDVYAYLKERRRLEREAFERLLALEDDET